MMKTKKNKVWIIGGSVIGGIILLIGALLLTYNILLGKVSKKSEVVYFTVETGTSTRNIITNLKEANLIKSEMAALIYVKLHNLGLQAGTYELDRTMDTKEIISKISKGEVFLNVKTLTFVEGRRLLSYVKTIASNYPYTEEEILNVLSNKEYLNSLIEKYWFLTDDILDNDIYYPLEGYLYPDTYSFYADATIEEIIEKMLDNTSKKLEPYKEEILNSDFSVHELITLASIVELEAGGSDRAGVSSVFINRINAGWNLGSDVTTYYAEQKDFTVELSYQEYQECNAYNTRSTCFTGLPVGPICNMSVDSIKAAIEPSDTDYYYFVADKNKKTYFSKTYEEQQEVINKLQQEGLWFVY